MAFSADERARIKAHLGYPSITTGAIRSAGLIEALPFVSVMESNLDRADAYGENLVREYLAKLADIDAQLDDARQRLAVTALGDLKIRETETRALREERTEWCKRVADVLSVPFNPFSAQHDLPSPFQIVRVKG